MLTVYHGSTYCVEQPLAGICRPNLDFGIGFYVTNLQEQAARWALRIADDRVIRTIDLYISGDYSRDEALNRLIHQETNNQICIINQEVIESHLHFVEASRLPNLSFENPAPNAVDVVMQGKYFGIVEQLATRLHISAKKALDIFYNTDTYKRLTQRIGDLYLMSDLYILDEVIRELQAKQ